MTYQAGIQQQRTYNNTVFNAFNPYYVATLNLAVTQPLLKNAGMNAGKRQLKLAFVNEDSRAAQALIDASNTLSQVEDSYWNLVAAWRNVAIQEDALQEAIAQQRSNVRLARRGAAAPVDAVESQTQVSNFQDNVYSALQTVSQLQVQLKSLIVADPGDPIWTANLVPSTSVQQLPSAGELAQIIAEGQRNRPEVRQAEDKRLAADIDRVFAANQSLPQADVQMQYLSNGFAGILAPVPTFLLNECFQVNRLYSCPTPPPNTQGSMPYAYHNMWAGYFPTFNFALVVGYPVQGSLARGMRGVASEESAQAAISMQGVQERIAAEARNALQSYKTALSKLSAARHSRAAAEAVYASEVRQFHRGESTTYLVLKRQVQLEQARGLELQAQTQLNQSVVELQRVEGTILTANGVERSDARGAGSGALDDAKSQNSRALGLVAGAALILAVVPFERTSAQPDEPCRSARSCRRRFRRPHLAIPPSVAPGYRAPEVEPSDPGIVGVTQSPFVGIALQDAVGMALLRNPNLAVSASNVRIARYRVIEAKSNFDVALQVEPSSNFSVLPPENHLLRGPGRRRIRL